MRECPRGWLPRVVVLVFPVDIPQAPVLFTPCAELVWLLTEVRKEGAGVLMLRTEASEWVGE